MFRTELMGDLTKGLGLKAELPIDAKATREPRSSWSTSRNH